MNEARNKPRVFLSHSKRDLIFVQRLYGDLRHCQIDPWLDSEEIRHGQPWLDAIFESGIPTCDCVLVYLTPHSLESALVKKEIDASLITKLRDKHILFLPYVSETSVRGKLRPDIQALQTPEWNDSNYQKLLPYVVAEIWRGFKERTTLAVVNEEKVRRLEAELEISKLKGEKGGVFSEGEDEDFRYIWNALDCWEPISASQIQSESGKEKTIKQVNVFVHIRSLLPFLAGPNDFEHKSDSVFNLLKDLFEPIQQLKENRAEKISVRFDICPDLSDRLLIFGLLERRERPQYRSDSAVQTRLHFGPPRLYTCIYTQKMDRFKYWISFNGIMPSAIEWSAELPAGTDAEKRTAQQ